MLKTKLHRSNNILMFLRTQNFTCTDACCQHMRTLWSVWYNVTNMKAYLTISVIQCDQHERHCCERGIGHTSQPSHQCDKHHIVHQHHTSHGKAKWCHSYKVGCAIAISFCQSFNHHCIACWSQTVQEQPPTTHPHTFIVQVTLRCCFRRVGISIVDNLFPKIKFEQISFSISWKDLKENWVTTKQE